MFSLIIAKEVFNFSGTVVSSGLIKQGKLFAILVASKMV